MSAALTKTWTSYGAPTPENKLQLKTFPASMEVNAHFAAGGGPAGVDLIRREWGFMLNDPLGTKSTFPEALRADGCVCSTYTSMAHGWAAGPDVGTHRVRARRRADLPRRRDLALRPAARPT